MTLILTLANRDSAYLLSDRLLTSHRGPEDSNAEKSIALRVEDGRFAVGFTGLARFRSIDIHTWLMDALYACGEPDCSASGTIQRLRDRATKDFSSLPSLVALDTAQKGLIIVFIGYLYDSEPPKIRIAVLSNCMKFDPVRFVPPESDFAARFITEPGSGVENAAFADRFGAIAAVSREQLDPLRFLLREQRPRKAIIGKGVEVMREAALRDATRSIGSDLNWIRIPADPSESMESGYSSSGVVVEEPMSSAVSLRPGGAALVRGMKITAVGPDPFPLGVPTPPSRRHPCPCGSGKRYKLCHGARPRYRGSRRTTR